MPAISQADAINAGVKAGDRGPLVVDIRSRLAARGFGRGVAAPDPDLFDDAMKQAVFAFQEARRLRVDGIVGPHTWKELGGTVPAPGVQPSGIIPVEPPPQTDPDAPAGPSPLVMLAAVAGVGAIWWFSHGRKAFAEFANGSEVSDDDEGESAFSFFGAGTPKPRKPPMSPEERKARAKERRVREAADEQAALVAESFRIAHAREASDTAYATREAERAKHLVDLMRGGMTRGEAEMRIAHEAVQGGQVGPKDADTRNRAALMNKLRAQAVTYDPALDPNIPGAERELYVLEPGMTKAEAGTVMARVSGAQRAYLERLLRTGLGPVSAPSGRSEKVSPSLRRAPKEVFRLSPSEAALRREGGGSSSTYFTVESATPGISPGERAAIIEARAEDAEARHARTAAIREGMTREEINRERLARSGVDVGGSVITIEVDGERFRTDKSYMLAQKDTAVRVARDTGRKVQLRPAGFAPVLTRGERPETFVPATFTPAMRVNPSVGPNISPDRGGARGGETRFTPSSMVPGPRESEQSTLNILFKYDPRKYDPRKGKRPLGDFRDVVTDARIDAAADLAMQGDCNKAVTQLFLSRGLVNTPHERALHRRVIAVVDGKCRPELDEAVETLAPQSLDPWAHGGRRVIEASMLDPSSASGITVVRGKRRSGAQKRKTQKPLTPRDFEVRAVARAGDTVEFLPLQTEEEASPEMAAERAALVGAGQRRIRPEDVGGNRMKAKEITFPADGSAPYYLREESKGAGRKPAMKKVKLTDEAVAKLPPPLAIVRKKDGSTIFRLSDLPTGGRLLPDSRFDPRQLKMGTEVEGEHTRNKKVARRIAKDHLAEDSRYYTKLLNAGL